MEGKHIGPEAGARQLESLDTIKRPACSPCNWSEGGFISFDEYDYESDPENDDADAIREYSSTSGSESDEQPDQTPRKAWGVVDEDRGNPEDIVINAVVRHVAVSMSVYSVYYNAMVRSAARRDWIQTGLRTMQHKKHRHGHHGQAGSDAAPHCPAASECGSDMNALGSDQDSDIFLPRHHPSWMEHCEDRHRFRPHSWKEFSLVGLPILPPDHPLAMTWSIMMMIVDGIYSSFMVPLGAAFCFHPEHNLSWCTITEYIVGPIFCLNVFISFHVGFVISCNLRRMYLMRPHLISRFYVLHGGFWLDMLGVVAFCVQMVMLIVDENRSALVIIRLLLIMRIIRVYRLVTVMMVASVSESTGKEVSTLMSSLGVYLLTLVFTAAFFINFFACLFYMIADIEGLDKSWVGRYDSIYGPNSEPSQEILEAGWLRHWQLGIYYVTTTMMTVGFGDITPATMPEQLVAILMMLTAVCLFAFLISSMGEALNNLTADARSGAVVRRKLGEVLQWMEDRNVGAGDRKRIMGYYSSVWRLHQKEHESELQIFAELPNVLRAKVAKSLVKQLLCKSIILPSRRDPTKFVQWNLHPAHVEMLAERFIPVEVMPGHELFEEGDDADSVYLLEEGRLEVWQHQSLLYLFENPRHMGFNADGTARTEQRPHWIGNSSILGFFDIPAARKRPMRLRAQVTTKLWRIELESLKPVMRTQLEFVKLLIRIFRYNMVEALRRESSGSRGPGIARPSMFMRPSEPDSPTGSEPAGGHVELIPDQWSEFDAFMRLEGEPDALTKMMNYKRWADQLEKAKTSQIVSMMGKILAESPISNEVNALQEAESAASQSVSHNNLQQASAALKNMNKRPPVHPIPSFKTVVLAATSTLPSSNRLSSPRSLQASLQSDDSSSVTTFDRSNHSNRE